MSYQFPLEQCRYGCIQYRVGGCVDGKRWEAGPNGHPRLLKAQWPVIRSLDLGATTVAGALSPVTSAILNSTALGSTEASGLSSFRFSALAIARSTRLCDSLEGLLCLPGFSSMIVAVKRSFKDSTSARSFYHLAMSDIMKRCS